MAVKIPRSIQNFIDENRIPLVLSDAKDPEEPILLANQCFCDMTGFSAVEIVGQNCRFMHGPATQKAARDTIRGDFAANRDTSILIRNHRKSGEPFDNFLYIFTLFDADNTAEFRIGSQFEIPSSRRADAFERHIDVLRAGLDAINCSGDLPSHRLIDLAPLGAMNASALLFARLNTLKAA